MAQLRSAEEQQQHSAVGADEQQLRRAEQAEMQAAAALHAEQVREHSSAVERCGPHVAIFPVMLRSSDRGDVGAHYHQLLAHALHLPEPLRHTLAGVAPNIQTYVLHSDEELIDSSYDGE